MSTTIKYLNEFGEIVNSQQIINMINYSKLFSENGITIKEEFYKNNILESTCFHINSESEIVGFLQSNPNATFSFSYFLDIFKINEFIEYKNGLINTKIIHVNNQSNQTIAYQRYIIENNILTLSNIEKFYYENGEKKYDFEYNSEGSCVWIYNNIEYQSDIFALDIGNSDLTVFTWQGFEYYQFAEPLIPNTPIV